MFMDFNPANHILIAADSIEQLRRGDVERLFDEANPEHHPQLCDYISKNRPDLASEARLRRAEAFLLFNPKRGVS